MNVGVHCFDDEYIIERINKLGQIGNCDFTGKIDVQVASIEIIKGLMSDFISLIETDDKATNVDLLTIEQLNKEYNFLSEELKVYEFDKLLETLFGKGFSQTTKIKFKYDLLSSFELHKESQQWEEFSNRIKYVRRFFGDFFELNKFESLFEFFTKKIEKGEILYRGRVNQSDDKLSDEEMKMPPKNFARGGRANPDGIAYLYLAKEKETTIHEIRSNLYDSLTIAHFKAQSNIQVLDLSQVKKVSPFRSSASIAEFLENRPFLEKLEYELRKPIRKNDLPIEYLPTQYFCEYVRSLDMFDGIVYGSAMHKGGKNIVLFNANKVEIIKTEKIEIENIKYTFTQVN